MQSVRLRAWQLRDVFNRSRLWERHLRGELEFDRTGDATPRPENKQPDGTRSIAGFLVRVEGDGRRKKLAFVHYYLLPDGTINNSAGKPDPKWCEVDGTRYILDL